MPALNACSDHPVLPAARVLPRSLGTGVDGNDDGSEDGDYDGDHR